MKRRTTFYDRDGDPVTIETDTNLEHATLIVANESTGDTLGVDVLLDRLTILALSKELQEAAYRVKAAK